MKLTIGNMKWHIGNMKWHIGNMKSTIGNMKWHIGNMKSTIGNMKLVWWQKWYDSRLSGRYFFENRLHAGFVSQTGKIDGHIGPLLIERDAFFIQR